jgi:hypothetical protein
MIEQQKSRQQHYMKRTILKEIGDDATVDDLLQHLLGDDEGSGNYVVHKYKYNKKRTIMNRINMCWVWPVFLISIPFTWLFTGDWGINRNSKIGKIVDWLIDFKD